MPGADIRLALEISTEVRRKMRLLQLDPTDTTGIELYGALKARLVEDEGRIKQSLAVGSDDPEELLRAVADHMNKTEQGSQIIAIKSAVAKRILKKLKPKATMKLLGYRSLDSMLKHETIAELLAVSMLAESHEWHAKRLAEYRKLTPSNFEQRAVHFSVPKGKNWPKIAERYTEEFRHNILTVPELGAVVVLPLKAQLSALAITTITLCVHAMNDVRASSAYLKMHQVRPDFGEIVANMVYDEWSQVAELHNKELSWHTMHWFYGSEHNTSSHPELFEPHVQPEDMWLSEAEEILLKLDPNLQFWKGTHFLGMLDNVAQPVSMNILDVALSVCNARAYSSRFAHHMQRALHRELLGRYLAHPVLHKEVGASLEARLAPEFSFD